MSRKLIRLATMPIFALGAWAALASTAHADTAVDVNAAEGSVTVQGVGTLGYYTGIPLGDLEVEVVL